MSRQGLRLEEIIRKWAKPSIAEMERAYGTDRIDKRKGIEYEPTEEDIEEFELRRREIQRAKEEAPEPVEIKEITVISTPILLKKLLKEDIEEGTWNSSYVRNHCECLTTHYPGYAT